MRPSYTKKSEGLPPADGPIRAQTPFIWISNRSGADSNVALVSADEKAYSNRPRTTVRPGLPATSFP